jgi:hypothetical protein
MLEVFPKLGAVDDMADLPTVSRVVTNRGASRSKLHCHDSEAEWRILEPLHSACKRRDLSRLSSQMSTRPSARALAAWAAARTTCLGPVGAMAHRPSLLRFECRPRRVGSCFRGAKVRRSLISDMSAWHLDDILRSAPQTAWPGCPGRA